MTDSGQPPTAGEQLAARLQCANKLTLGLLVAAARDDDAGVRVLLSEVPRDVLAETAATLALAAAVSMMSELELRGLPADSLFEAFPALLLEMSSES